MALLSQYFDPDEYDISPIKSQINTDIFLTLNPLMSQNFYYKISMNHVNLYDSYFYDGWQPEKKEYLDYRFIQF